MTNLELIRQKCIEANPEIESAKRKLVRAYDDEHLDSERIYYQNVKVSRPIRLVDVLLAIDKFHGNMFVDEVGCFVKPKRKEFTYNYVIKNDRNIKWNLHQDDLSKQSEETIKFIAELLNG